MLIWLNWNQVQRKYVHFSQDAGVRMHIFQDKVKHKLASGLGNIRSTWLSIKDKSDESIVCVCIWWWRCLSRTREPFSTYYTKQSTLGSQDRTMNTENIQLGHAGLHQATSNLQIVLIRFILFYLIDFYFHIHWVSTIWTSYSFTYRDAEASNFNVFFFVIF